MNQTLLDCQRRIRAHGKVKLKEFKIYVVLEVGREDREATVEHVAFSKQDAEWWLSLHAVLEILPAERGAATGDAIWSRRERDGATIAYFAIIERVVGEDALAMDDDWYSGVRV